MKVKVLPFLLVLLALTAFAPKPKLTATKLASNLTVGVPPTFVAMPDAGIAVKYPAPRKPIAVKPPCPKMRQ